MDKVKKIFWSSKALKRFEDLLEYIAKDSKYYASEFGKRILYLVEKLELFPYLGRIVPEYNREDIRELIYTNYRIVYYIKDNSINIIYIGHAAKQLPDLSPESEI